MGEWICPRTMHPFLCANGCMQHRACLLCAACNKRLDTHTLSDKDGEPFCRACYAKVRVLACIWSLDANCLAEPRAGWRRVCIAGEGRGIVCCLVVISEERILNIYRRARFLLPKGLGFIFVFLPPTPSVHRPCRPRQRPPIHQRMAPFVLKFKVLQATSITLNIATWSLIAFTPPAVPGQQVVFSLFAALWYALCSL